MRKSTLALLLVAAFSLTPVTKVDARITPPASPNVRSGATVPAPEDVLGFRPGDDRKLASWNQVVDYFQKLAAASGRVRFERLGKTTMGAPFVMATISAPENLSRLEEYKKIQQRLADPRLLGANRERQAAQLISRGKTIVLITCGIHSTEVGSYLSSMLIAHRLASSEEPLVREILRDTIILLVPSLNPDGVDIVKNWYDRTLGTPFEGTEPPELYHQYTGHDNNRDWYAFTQVETQLTVDKIHNTWHPQIVHDIHQQGAYGPRLFLPPYMRPVEPNVPRQIVEGYTELGLAMKDELSGAGLTGITWDSTYDAWTPARAYSHYHGGVRILSETASAKIATPISVRPEELRPGLGYDARKRSENYPSPWPGGEWRMREITNYMTGAAFSLLSHAAKNRERWLRRFYQIGSEAVRPRRDGELFGFLIDDASATKPNRERLFEILERGGVVIEHTTRGFLIRMDQPYGAFAKALLEYQKYPDLRDSSGNPVSPYDVTAHTLSLLMGVEAKPVYAPFRYRSVDVPMLTGGGDLKEIKRLALYRSHVPSMDEGWTRWVLKREIYKGNRFSPSSVRDAELRAGSLRAKYDTIIIPDQSPATILEGWRAGRMPTEITGGIGAEGARSLREFVEAGGTLVCLNRASGFAIEQLRLPVRDLTAGLKRTEFYAPGSILRTELDTAHPMAAGMPRESVAWVEGSPVFEISDDREAGRVRVVARYPNGSNPLLSGWLLGGERMRGRAALVEVMLGRGRVILFGFRPQYRGQSLATYPLFFNAISGVGY
ncbi:MAG TPA: M14 metallopeptidase family protein [Pyrinomonadaceae bacterium]